MRFLVLQHLDVEHPGVFRDFWREDGVRYDAVELDEGERIPADFSPYDAMIVMGGPMNVWDEAELPWLRDEKAAIRRWLDETGRPFLGVCLGHQLLATAIGGEVGPSAQPEVGLTDVDLTEAGLADPLIGGLGSPMLTFQWHGAEVQSLPDGCTVLAQNDACAVQAFRYGPQAYGLQFHVEITETTFEDWQAIPAYQAALDEALGADGAAAEKARVDAVMPQMNAAARRLNDNFMGLFAPATARAEGAVA